MSFFLSHIWRDRQVLWNTRNGLPKHFQQFVKGARVRRWL